ncbi:MAG: cell division protein FtsA, partial [Bryobacteraceae bacterium]
MASKAKLATGLDLGSTSTRVVICALEEESLKFLGYGEAPVQGWTRGRLTDQGALTESIQFALHEA